MSKTILVTGATSGFGKAIATRFAKEGYDVIITGRRAERLAALQAELQDAYDVRVRTMAFDVRDRAATIAAFDGLKGQVDRIDILVNNAGLAAGLSTID